MADLDRRTLQPIDNLQSTMQSVEMILTTRLYSRVMLREFGMSALEILGRLLTAKLLPRFLQLVASSIDHWEKRFKVRRINAAGSVTDLRQGRVGIAVEVDYRPRAHLSPPDYTVERVFSFSIMFGKSGITVA